MRIVHIACVVISLSGFLLRGLWVWQGSSLLAHPATRILPHVNDTILLGSAVWLSLLIHQYPFTNSWLTAKVIALLVYIVLGSIALKRGPTRRIRAIGFGGAILSFGYIVAVARAHNPWPFP